MASVFTLIIEDIAIFIIAIVLVAITAGYAAAAAAKITDISNWKDNSKLASAHSYLSWAATVGWIYIGLIVILIILLIILALTGEFDFGLSDIIEASFLPAILNITNLLTVGVLLTTGILSAVGTAEIDKANVSNNEGSKSKALTATIVSIGSLGLILIFIVGEYFFKTQQKKKAAEEAQQQTQTETQTQPQVIEQLAALKKAQ